MIEGVVWTNAPDEEPVEVRVAPEYLEEAPGDPYWAQQAMTAALFGLLGRGSRYRPNGSAARIPGPGERVVLFVDAEGWVVARWEKL